MNRRRTIAVLVGALTVLASGAPVSANEAPSKKRAAPPPAPSIVARGVRYQAVERGEDATHDGHAGYVAATRIATGRELWVVRVYAVHYDPNKETDVQDLFIAALKIVNRGRTLQVTDERGGQYGINLKTRAVTKL